MSVYKRSSLNLSGGIIFRFNMNKSADKDKINQMLPDTYFKDASVENRVGSCFIVSTMAILLSDTGIVMKEKERARKY